MRKQVYPNQISYSARKKQHLQELFKTLKNEFKKEEPIAIKKLQENFMYHAPNSTYFTTIERDLIRMYNKKYSVWNNENVALFEADLMNNLKERLTEENVVQKGIEWGKEKLKQAGNWIAKNWKAAKEKIIKAFGSIKDFITEVMKNLLNAMKEGLIKVYNTVKDKLTNGVPKALDKVRDFVKKDAKEGEKSQIEKEGTHLAQVAAWVGKAPIEGAIKAFKAAGEASEKLGQAAAQVASKAEEFLNPQSEEEPELALAESIKMKISQKNLLSEQILLEQEMLAECAFSDAAIKQLVKQYTRKILREEEEGDEKESGGGEDGAPELKPEVTKESMSVWKKYGIKGWIIKIIAAIFNPIKTLLITAFEKGQKILMNGVAKAIEKIGGPPAISYVVYPVIGAALIELLVESAVGHAWVHGLAAAIGAVFPVAVPFVEGIAVAIEYVIKGICLYEVFHTIHENLKKDSGKEGEEKSVIAEKSIRKRVRYA